MKIFRQHDFVIDEYPCSVTVAASRKDDEYAQTGSGTKSTGRGSKYNKGTKSQNSRYGGASSRDNTRMSYEELMTDRQSYERSFPQQQVCLFELKLIVNYYWCFRVIKVDMNQLHMAGLHRHNVDHLQVRQCKYLNAISEVRFFQLNKNFHNKN